MLLYGAVFFFYGYGLWARRALLDDLKRHGNLAVLWASALALYALHLVMLGVLRDADGGGASGAAAWLALVEVVARGHAAVLLALALMGSCEALLRAPRPWVRWMADASYWIYLVHLPVVAWLTFWLGHLDRAGRLAALTGFAWSAELKFLAATIATTVFGLLTYRYLVRDSPLGTLLNGTRGRPH